MRALAEEYDKKREAFVSDIREEFTKVCTQLFDEYPLVRSFGWTQYTPFFNDGDECTFSVNSDYPEVNGHWEFQEEVNNMFPKEDWDQVVERVSEILRLIPEDIMLDMFGDHSEVTVTKEGVEVTYYDHD